MVDRMEVCWFFLPFCPRELGLPMRGFQAGRLAQAQGWSDAGQRAVTPTKEPGKPNLQARGPLRRPMRAEL